MADLNQTLIASIDQGSSNSRLLLYTVKDWKPIFIKKVGLETLYPNDGWCEQDPMVILNTVKRLLIAAYQFLQDNAASKYRLVALGITNQRETVVAWDKATGNPLYNAILWNDSRTQGIVDELIGSSPGGKFQFKEICGLPISTYFSAGKIRWLLDNQEEVQAASTEGRLMVGTVDTWLIWNLTGNRSYVTDVTNASRTMLMNLKTLEWDTQLCTVFGIDRNSLAKICSSTGMFGKLSYQNCPFKDVPITACLGDQQAALVGQRCFKEGMAKNTLGTGTFMLYNVGENVIYSKQGLLTTVAYQFGKDAKPVYALEASIGGAGDAVQCLINMDFLKNAHELEACAKTVKDNGGIYFVPAFNGLLAPYWRPNAQSIITGITLNTQKGHFCRATIEALAFQTLEVLNRIQLDSRLELKAILVDGGMSNNDLLMQTLANILGIDVIRSEIVERTAFGAALAAAFPLGLWSFDSDPIPGAITTFRPTMDKSVRDEKFRHWEEVIRKC